MEFAIPFIESSHILGKFISRVPSALSMEWREMSQLWVTVVSHCDESL